MQYYLSNLTRCGNRMACECMPTCTTNGDVPVWNSTTNRYECGSVTGTGSSTFLFSYSENYGGALNRYTSASGAYTSTTIESEHEHIIGSGSFETLYINVIENTQTSPITLTLRVNNAPTTLTQVIPATTIATFTVTNSVAVNAGDVITIEASCADNLTFYARTTLEFQG